MQYLFLVFGSLTFAVLAPPRVSLSLLATIGIISIVLKMTAAKIVGPISFVDALRAVAWAFALLTLAVVGLLWASQGQLHVEGAAALALLCGLFVALVIGVRIAIQASFSGGAAIAAVSTAVSSLLLFALKPVLF